MKRTLTLYNLTKLCCNLCGKELEIGDVYYRSPNASINYKAYCEDCYNNKIYYDVEDTDDNLEWIEIEDNKWILINKNNEDKENTNPKNIRLVVCPKCGRKGRLEEKKVDYGVRKAFIIIHSNRSDYCYIGITQYPEFYKKILDKVD